MIRIYLIIIVAGLLVTGGAGCKSKSASHTNIPATPSSHTQSIQWQEDLPIALAMASKQNKLVLVDFYTDWCGYCKKLDEETYPDPAVSSAINQRFIAVRIDAEKERTTASKYDVTGYPTIVILNAQGKEVSRIVGYLPPKEFNAKLSTIEG